MKKTSFTVTNPFVEKKCNKENKSNSYVNNIKQNIKNNNIFDSKGKPNSKNNIYSLLSTFKNDNSLKKPQSHNHNVTFDTVNQNQLECDSSDELPEPSTALTDSHFNDSKVGPTIKKKDIKDFFNFSNSSNKKKNNSNVDNNKYSKLSKSKNMDENSDDEIKLPKPDEAIYKSMHEKKWNNDFDLYKKDDRIKSTSKFSNSLQNLNKKVLDSNRNKNMNIPFGQKQKNINYDEEDDDSEIPESAAEFLSKSFKAILNSKPEMSNNNNNNTIMSIKNFIVNNKDKSEFGKNKKESNFIGGEDDLKSSKALLKEIRSNHNKRNNISKDNNIKRDINRINNNNNSNSNNVIKNKTDNNNTNVSKPNSEDDDSIFPKSESFFKPLNTKTGNNDVKKKRKKQHQINKYNNDGLKNTKVKIDSLSNLLKDDNSLLNENKKRPCSSMDKYSENLCNYHSNDINKIDDDNDSDVDTLITSEELFQKLASEKEKNDDNSSSFDKKAKTQTQIQIQTQTQTKIQTQSQEHQKSYFDIMKGKPNNVKLNKQKKEDTIDKNQYKSSKKFKSDQPNSSTKVMNSKIKNSKSDPLLKSHKKLIKNDDDKNNLKLKKLSEKIGDNTISKNKNNHKKNVKKFNSKASLQTILTFSVNNSNSKLKKDTDSKNDIEGLFQDINHMEEMFEKQKSVSDKYNMIKQSLEKSETHYSSPSSNTNTNTNPNNEKDDHRNDDNDEAKDDKKNNNGDIHEGSYNFEEGTKVDSAENNGNYDIKRSEEDQKCNQQFTLFKQMVKEFENEEFDENIFNFDIDGLKNNSSGDNDKSKIKPIRLEDYLKSGKLLSLKKRNIINSNYNSQGDKATFKCPYCKYEYYEDIDKSIYKEIQNFLEINHMKKDGKIITYNIPLIKQYEFCRLHQAKLIIIPEGIKKGYPLHIDFSSLKQRIYSFKEDLFNIIYGKKKSYFRELALNEYKKLGTNKARNFNSLINRFEKILVGYYGSKGFNIITEILQEMFFVKTHHSSKDELDTDNLKGIIEDSNSERRRPNVIVKTKKILTYELSKPQEPFEYIQEVLVPECGIRLIAEDKHLNKDNDEELEKALKIMKESNDFGLVVHEYKDFEN